MIDTDILIGFLRDNEEAVNKIKEFYNAETQVLTTSITLFELFKGAYASNQQEKKIIEVEALLEETDVLSFDSKSSKILGKIYNELKKKETQLTFLTNSSQAL